jgi:Uncharacterized protein conserved in bacteria (DUF2188)
MAVVSNCEAPSENDMDACLFTVAFRDDLRWHICEAGVDRSLASFGLKEDAIEYARGLGLDGQRAEVVVLQPRVRRRERIEA